MTCLDINNLTDAQLRELADTVREEQARRAAQSSEARRRTLCLKFYLHLKRRGVDPSAIPDVFAPELADTPEVMAVREFETLHGVNYFLDIRGEHRDCLRCGGVTLSTHGWGGKHLYTECEHCGVIMAS